MAGVGLMVIAWPLQVLALALAPITVVAPLLATTQLVLLAVARLRLRERVGRLEAGGALAIVAGVSVVVWAGPRHAAAHVGAARLALPLVLVGGLAVTTFVFGRLRPQLTIALVIGAGLSYAWVDFVNKLLANALSVGHLGPGVLWLGAILGFGTLAFLEETTALARRPAVTVAPVIGAVHDPLPVLMALWAGVAAWGPDPHRVPALILGLAVIAVGAAILGRSKAVARISGGADLAAEGALAGCRGCSPNPSWVGRARRRASDIGIGGVIRGHALRRGAPSLADDG